MISFVLVSRNDNYEGNPMDRLKLSMKKNIANLKKHFHHDFKNFNFYIGDWGSDVPINKQMINCEEYDNVHLVFFSKEITNLFDTEFNEVHPLNFLIRNSINDFVARLDQDIIIGDKFFDYIKNNKIYDNKLYWSTRRELDWNYGGNLNNNSIYFDPNREDFWKGEIGIILTHKKNWFDVKGYDENYIHLGHMEHGLYIRFENLLKKENVVNLSKLLDIPFYHIHHSRNQHNSRKQNPIEIIDFRNDDDWGLEKYKHLIEIK